MKSFWELELSHYKGEVQEENRDIKKGKGRAIPSPRYFDAHVPLAHIVTSGPSETYPHDRIPVLLMFCFLCLFFSLSLTFGSLVSCVLCFVPRGVGVQGPVAILACLLLAAPCGSGKPTIVSVVMSWSFPTSSGNVAPTLDLKLDKPRVIPSGHPGPWG